MGTRRTSATDAATSLLALVLGLAACSSPPRAVRTSLAVATPFELIGLDPHSRDTLASAAILSNVYEALVEADPEMRIRPCLAARWESPDPLTWVFRLRPGVRFQSGRALRAADVAFSYRRLLADASLQAGRYLVNVAEVKAQDDLTVEVRTKEPLRILLNKLSHVPVVPEGARASLFAAGGDGTGPYRIRAWTPGVRLLLERNEGYWGDRPAMQRVEFALGRAPEDAMRGLLSGRYQLIRADSRKIAAAVEGSGRFRLLRQDNLFVKYIGFDLSRPPFDDLRVRRALDLAIDRDALVGGLESYAEPASQPVPRFVFGFDPDIGPRRHDLDSAAALLHRSGHAGGLEAPLYVRQLFGEAASLLSRQVAAAGFRLDVKIVRNAEFYARLEGRGAPLWLNSGGCATGDASDLFDPMVHSADAGHRFGTQNFGGFSDRELDAAIERSAGLEKPAARLGALQEIMRAVVDRLVVAPLYNDQDVYALDPGLAWSPRSDSYILAKDVGVAR